jgi:speckle-type POZ protein
MAAGPERPRARSASMRATEKARGTHSFKIADYSLHKGLGVGKFIDSGTFAVGGYEWHLRYYPDGFREGTKEYVGVFLRIVTKGGVEVVRVVFDLRIVNQATGASSSVFSFSSTTVYNESDRCWGRWGTSKFMQRSKLEVPSFIRDDCLVVECDVTVIKTPLVEDITIPSDFVVQVPPSDLSENFGKFLDSQEIADVSM